MKPAGPLRLFGDLWLPKANKLFMGPRHSSDENIVEISQVILLTNKPTDADGNMLIAVDLTLN